MELEITVPGLLDGILQDSKAAEFFEKVAQQMEDAVKEWYSTPPRNEAYFDNPEKPHGTRSYVRTIANAWYHERVGKQINVYFSHPHPNGTAWGLRMHHLGAIITPKKAKALTIPLTFTARDKTARNYSNSVRELFMVRARDGASPDLIGTLCEKDSHGIHAVYAIRKSAEIKPLEKRRGHPAIPTEKELAETFTLHCLNNLSDFL